MSRCWGCCQENCGFTMCTCDCHSNADREYWRQQKEEERRQREAEASAARQKVADYLTAQKAVVEAARGVRYKTKKLREALRALDALTVKS